MVPVSGCLFGDRCSRRLYRVRAWTEFGTTVWFCCEIYTLDRHLDYIHHVGSAGCLWMEQVTRDRSWTERNEQSGMGTRSDVISFVSFELS